MTGVCLCFREAALHMPIPTSLDWASGPVSVDRFSVKGIQMTPSVRSWSTSLGRLGTQRIQFGMLFGQCLGQWLGMVALPVILTFNLHVKSLGSDICGYEISVIISW